MISYLFEKRIDIVDDLTHYWPESKVIIRLSQKLLYQLAWLCGSGWIIGMRYYLRVIETCLGFGLINLIIFHSAMKV